MKMYNENQNASGAVSAPQITNNELYFLSGMLHASLILDDVESLKSILTNEMCGNVEVLKEVLKNEKSSFKDSIYNSSIECCQFLSSINVIFFTIDKFNYLEVHVNDNSNLDDNLIKLTDLEENWYICEQIYNRYHFDLLQFEDICNNLYFESEIPINSIFEGDNFRN